MSAFLQRATMTMSSIPSPFMSPVIGGNCGAREQESLNCLCTKSLSTAGEPVAALWATAAKDISEKTMEKARKTRGRMNFNVVSRRAPCYGTQVTGSHGGFRFVDGGLTYQGNASGSAPIRAGSASTEAGWDVPAECLCLALSHQLL